MELDYEKARALLESSYADVEPMVVAGKQPTIGKNLAGSLDEVFSSKTQSYREVLLGCVIAKSLEPKINVRHIYVAHGDDAFSGRTLDERVINPFLQNKRIPSSKGPYLSTFRRSVRLTKETASGLRDQDGYAAMLEVVAVAEKASPADVQTLLRLLMWKFLKLRESSLIPVTKLHRMSFDQYDRLLKALLDRQSGGRFPVLLVVATFEAIKSFFNTDWSIDFQGINVADSASGVGGDVTIKSKGTILLAAEITERPVGKQRVISTFNSKIGPNSIAEYLFFITAANVDSEARAQAHQYFAQGHEVNFLDIRQWIMMTLASIGRLGRERFNAKMVEMLEAKETPSFIKTAWNEEIENLTTTPKAKD